MQSEIPVPIYALEFPFEFEIDPILSSLTSFTLDGNSVIDLVLNTEARFTMKIKGGDVSVHVG